MSDTVKITDLVPQSTIDELVNLRTEMGYVVRDYKNVAVELANGLKIKVEVIGDLDRLMGLVETKTREATQAMQKMNDMQQRYNTIVGQTTPVIARQLMEQDKANRATQQQYTSFEKAKQITQQYNDTLEGQAQRVAQLTTKMSEIKKRMDDNKKAYKEGSITLDEFNNRNAALILQYESLKQEKAKVNQLMTAEIKMNQSGEQSYNQLSQQLELMKKTYKDMSAEMQNSQAGVDLLAQINELDSHLKDVAGNMGEFQRNVGNYAIAGRDGVVSTESLTAALQKQAVTTKDLQDQNRILAEAKNMLKREDANYPVLLQQINAKIEENNKALGINTQEQESAKKSLKELVQEIANLTIQYNSLSDAEKNSADGKALAAHIQELTEKAGVLKDAIADTNRAISNASSDTRAFDQVTEGAQLAANAFGLVQGTAAILGVEEGKLAEVQTKLMAAITLANAASKVQNLLQKESAVMQAVATAQTKLRTVAENLHTAAQGKGVVMTKLLTAAQWAFNAAANANPIGLLVVAITALIAAGYGLIKLFKLIVGNNEEAKKSYEKHTEAINELCEAHDRLIEKMKALGATESAIHAQTLRNKQEEVVAMENLLKESERIYGKNSDEYKEALERKKKADEDFLNSKDNAENYIQKLVSETQAKIEEKTLGTYNYKRKMVDKEIQDQLELLNVMLQNGQIAYEQYKTIEATLKLRGQMQKEEIDKSEQEEKKRSAGRSSRSSRGGGKSLEDQQKELQKLVEEGEDALLNLISDAIERERKAENLRYQRQLADLEKQLSKLSEKEVTKREALNNKIVGLQAEHAKKLSDIEDSAYERDLNAQASFIQARIDAATEGSKEEYDNKLKLLEIQQKQEKQAIDKQETAHTLTVEQASEMRAGLENKFNKERLKLQEEYLAAKAEMIMKEYTVEEELRRNMMQSDLNEIQATYNERLKAAGDDVKKRENIELEYQRRIADVQNSFARQSAQASIDAIEQILTAENMSAEMREEWERKLTEARLELRKLEVEADTEATKRQIENAEKLMRERTEKAQRWLDVATQTMDAISGLTNTLFDGQIQKIEERQEAIESAGDEEIARIEELVEKRVITEEEGEARKRAAEKKTAEETEKLEKKKAELQHRQAVFQKATDLAQAGISTALAIINALNTQPFFPLGLAMAAIAGTMGAIQIATIAATPIPKYKEGTPWHGGGPAIVGDGGKREVVMIGEKAYLTPDTPTLVDLPKGASVYPDIARYAMANPLNTVPGKAIPDVVVNNDYKDLQREMREVGQLIRRQTRQQRRDAYNTRYELFKATKL